MASLGCRQRSCSGVGGLAPGPTDGSCTAGDAAAAVVATPDPVVAELHGRRILLTHGDLLCTADHAYQELRSTVRDPAFAERMLRHRERSRARWRAKQELLRVSNPELFAVRGLDPRQTTLTPGVRSTERKVDLAQCQTTDTSSTADAFDASLYWRSLQRDNGTPSLSSGSASL